MRKTMKRVGRLDVSAPSERPWMKTKRLTVVWTMPVYEIPAISDPPAKKRRRYPATTETLVATYELHHPRRRGEAA